MISIDCYNKKNSKREFMKKFNILMTTSALLLLSTGCVKPVQDTQAIYDTTNPVNSSTIQSGGTIYEEEVQGTTYVPSATIDSTIYGSVPDTTVINTSGVMDQTVSTTGGVTYADPYANGGTTTGTTGAYNDSYAGTTTTTTGTTSVYNDSYTTSQPTISDYPVTTSAYPASTAGQGGGIHLQIAALKDYYAAQEYKNRLSLAPGLSAYVQRGAMNKVIVSGIPSVAEANRLKERRFPGAFIVQGGNSGGYTPPVQPNYNTASDGGYNVNNPYGVSSSSGTLSSASGVGVQVGAFGSMSKAQSVADSQGGQYPAIVKKIGRYYKVILTGFSSRSAAKAYSGRVGGFVVNY